MPKITQEGVFSGDIRSDVNAILGQFAQPGASPTADFAQGTATQGGYLLFLTPASGLTAHAGGGQASGLKLTAQVNVIGTVASGNDSVVLPASAAGLFVVVANAAASNSANVYPSSGEAINAIAADSPFAVAAGKTAAFFCAAAGHWYSILTA